MTAPSERVGGGVHAQVDPGQRERRDQAGRDPLAELPPAAHRDQGVEHADQGRGEDRDRPRRHRPAGPAAAQLDPEGPRAVHRGQPDHQQDRQEGAHEHDQVAEAPQHQQRDHGRPAQRLDHAGRPGGGDDRLHQRRSGREGAARPATAPPRRPTPSPPRPGCAWPGRRRSWPARPGPPRRPPTTRRWAGCCAAAVAAAPVGRRRRPDRRTSGSPGRARSDVAREHRTRGGVHLPILQPGDQPVHIPAAPRGVSS